MPPSAYRISRLNSAIGRFPISTARPAETGCSAAMCATTSAPGITPRPVSRESAFQPRPDLSPLEAVGLLFLDERQFQERFAHTPLARPGRSGLLRNACLVLGNAGDASHVPALMKASNDDNPIIRDAARWALERISHRDEVAIERGSMRTDA